MHIRLRLVVIAITFCVAIIVILKTGLSIPLRSLCKGHHCATSNQLHLTGSVSAQVLHLVQAEAAKAEQRASGFAQNETQLLRQAFERCDSDGSSWLSITEAESCISKQVAQHVTQGLRENFFVFTATDINPRNGAVSWEEHVAYFLRGRGYDYKFIKEHLHSMKGLTRREKELLMRDKALWSEAARSDIEFLSLDEFLAFRHPESSHAVILERVEGMLAQRDADGDGALSRTEYLTPPGEERSEDGELHFTAEEFGDSDTDGDGVLSRKELLEFHTPNHPHHARVEARRLFAAADGDADGRLTLPELLLQPNLFVDSSLVDAGRALHREL